MIERSRTLSRWTATFLRFTISATVETGFNFVTTIPDRCSGPYEALLFNVGRCRAWRMGLEWIGVRWGASSSLLFDGRESADDRRERHQRKASL